MSVLFTVIGILKVVRVLENVVCICCICPVVIDNLIGIKYMGVLVFKSLSV